MGGWYKCPYCGGEIDVYDHDVDKVVSRKGATRTTVYFHKSCFKAENERRRKQREMKMQNKGANNHGPKL